MEKIAAEFLEACRSGLVPNEDLKAVRAAVSGMIRSDKKTASSVANCRAYWDRVNAEKKARAEAGLPPIPPKSRGPRAKKCKACGSMFMGIWYRAEGGGYLCPECNEKGTQP